MELGEDDMCRHVDPTWPITEAHTSEIPTERKRNLSLKHGEPFCERCFLIFLLIQVS